MEKPDMQAQRAFTGKHMAIILVAFFGVVMAVNFTMARFATAGFSGTVVDNSYVASQKFNGWLAAAEAQEKLGWQVAISRDAEGHILLLAKNAVARKMAITAQGVAWHPLGRKENIKLDFANDGEGHLRSTKTLPDGRWQLYITLRHGDQLMRIREDIQ